jgi:DNA repair protein RadC
MKIKNLAKNDRPREKLLNYGAKNLSDSELLAIILRTGSKKENVLELSGKIFSRYSLKKLSKLNLTSLQKENGIGFAKACQILACFEIGKRLVSFKGEEKIKIVSPSKLSKVFIPEMGSLDKENFKIVLLDSRNRIIKSETIFIGTLNESLVHPREIFKLAFEENAASIILLHNHPSGDVNPSEEDIKITKQLVSVSEIFGIEILDHLIIGENSYFSMKEKNLLF